MGEDFLKLNHTLSNELGEKPKESFIEILPSQVIKEFYTAISVDALPNQFEKIFPSIDEITTLSLKRKFTHGSRRTRNVIDKIEGQKDESTFHNQIYKMKLYKETVAIRNIRTQVESLFENKNHKNLDSSFSLADIYMDIALTDCYSNVYGDIFSLSIESFTTSLNSLFSKPRDEEKTKEIVGKMLSYKPNLNLLGAREYPGLDAKTGEHRDISSLIDYLDTLDLMRGVFFSDAKPRLTTNLDHNKLIFIGYKDIGGGFAGIFYGNHESDFKQLYNPTYQPDPPTLGLAGTLASMRSKGVKFNASFANSNLTIEIL